MEVKRNTDTKYVGEGTLVLQLYVSGMSPKSMEAIDRIKHLCEENFQGEFELEIIDLYKHPEAASDQQIVFSPSLIKRLPLPKKTLVGNFSDAARVIKGLGIVVRE